MVDVYTRIIEALQYKVKYIENTSKNASYKSVKIPSKYPHCNPIKVNKQSILRVCNQYYVCAINTPCVKIMAEAKHFSPNTPENHEFPHKDSNPR